jgi:hypothetical protein
MGCGCHASSEEAFIRRLRREAYGELIQIDGSEHRWFEDRGAPCSLLVFIGDATESNNLANLQRRASCLPRRIT